MERAILVNCAVLCVLALFVGVVSSAPYRYDNSNVKKNGDNEDEDSYLWFGPRLGRKKRNPNGDGEFGKNPALEREQLAALMEVMQESPWAIVAVNEGKRHTVNFTPRLGRESGEDFLLGPTADRWTQDQGFPTDLLTQRSPPFAPRLGRRLSPYSPRLGRENDKAQMS